MNPPTHLSTPTGPPRPLPGTPHLHELLDRELAISPVWRGHYSTHLAMALVGLEQLGAGPGVLDETYRRSSREAEPRDDHDRLAERIAEIERDGLAATVRHRAATLAEAPATALFHPLIRLAYALDIGHTGQVAAALLDGERRLDRLPLPDPRPGDRRLTDVAADLAAHPEGTWPRQWDLHGVARRPEMAAALAGLAHDGHTLDDVSAFAIAAHVTADDFVTLHLVTGARAVRAVSAWLDPADAQRLAEHAAAAMAVGYAVIGAPPLLDPDQLDAVRALDLPDVDEIAAWAVADHDPHVIKLANAALVEERRTGDALYRFAAARAVGLTAPAAARLG